jgi:hypothetical protein
VAFFILVGAKTVKVLPLIGPKKPRLIPIGKKAIAKRMGVEDTFSNTFNKFFFVAQT